MHGQSKPKFIVGYCMLATPDTVDSISCYPRKTVRPLQNICDLVLHKHLYFIHTASILLFPIILSQVSPFSIITFVPFILHFFKSQFLHRIKLLLCLALIILCHYKKAHLFFTCFYFSFFIHEKKSTQLSH